MMIYYLQETILRKQDILQQTSDGIDQKVLQALQNQKALSEKQEVSLKNQVCSSEFL